MLRARMKKVTDRERERAFREDLILLYKNFEAELTALCRKYDVQINCWYSPSTIPQPKFVIDGVAFDADDLCDVKATNLSDKVEKKAFLR